MAQALVNRMHQMSLRLAQILDPKRPRRTGLWKPVLAFTAGMLALVLGAAPSMPKLVAFQAQPGQSPAQPTQTAQRVLNAAEQPADSGMVRPVAERVAQSPRPEAEPRVISAVFHPFSAAAVPLQLKARSRRRPGVMRANARREQHPIQGSIIILRTTQYDGSGSGVWTLCIWRPGDKDPTIFVGSI